MKPKIVCVVGPTASGKTAYAVRLAQERGGEIVSCDSMQIYRYMDIGTAKPTAEEMRGVPHHMIDFVDPAFNYSVADYVRDARVCIDEILARGRLPVLCGGTGLYLDSLLQNVEFSAQNRDDAYRESLKRLAEEEGKDALYQRLVALDPETAAEVHPNNVKRVVRALEIIHATGMTKKEADRKALRESRYDAELIGLTADRELLYERINLRVDQMMAAGLLGEVKALLQRGVPRESTAMQAIGYKELVRFLDGFCTLSEAVDKIKQESRRYAKRQLTWFKRNEKIEWLDIAKF